MSLGLPEFGRIEASGSPRLLKIVRVTGIVVLAYMVFVSISLWNGSRTANAALEHNRDEVARIRGTADEARKRFVKNPDWLVALASVESSPERILEDLSPLIPEGVSISSFRVEYTTDAAARVDLTVLSNSPNAYDRFLSALTRSDAFIDIKPGSENRPGPLRATIATTHKPRRKAS